MYDRFLWKSPYQCFSPDAEKHRGSSQCHLLNRLFSATCASLNSYLKKPQNWKIGYPGQIKGKKYNSKLEHNVTFK